MSLVGMVAMGEYSDACICKAPGGGTAAIDADTDMILGSASTAAGSAGVIMQMRRAAQQAAAAGHR